MSWHFSQALVEAFSEANSLDGLPFAQWKLMSIAQDDLCSDKMKGICHRSPFGMMFVPLTDTNGKAVLTWCLEAFRVKTLVQPAQELDSRESDPDCGWKWQESLMKYDRVSCSWKTRQCSLLGGLAEYSETWPKSGLMLDGEVLPQEMKVPPLKGSDYLLPAPTKSMGKRGWGFSKSSKPRYRKEVQDNALAFGYKPHPTILEWSMGWPITWSLSEPLETDRFQQWLKQHGKH